MYVFECVSLMMCRQSHRGHSKACSMATEGIAVRQGQMKDAGECCRIRAGSPSLPERGPCCRGRAENSSAEGDREKGRDRAHK